jgi:cysteinyl-tRNA synthetase
MLKIYDTQSRAVKEVTSSGNEVTVYCCGPTVYRDAHVGNLRTFLLSDLIRRTIEIQGKQVNLVQNITDVGHMAEDINPQDKMLAQAKLEDIDPFEIARKYEAKFHTDLELLNIKPARRYPRASESIVLMHELITKLIELEHAYVGTDGSVYFAANSFPSYGAISGNRLSELKPGHRYEYTDEGGKRFHADWALWKAAGERTEMVWDSPWGRGFPGWHIECSAMSLEFLGNKIDLHIGGIDLRFPHHENERAQTNSVTNLETVNIWVHGEHLLFEGRKMAKSSGNVVLLSDIAARGYDPLSLRLCLLENRYRSQMDLTWDSIEAANSTLKRWRRNGFGKSVNYQSDQAVLEALNNDLDTPRVIQRLRNVEKDQLLSDTEKSEIFSYADQVLGLDLNREIVVPELPAELARLLADREVARSAKNWSESDRLRIELESAGLIINDTAAGQEWDLR